jgi:hypothetical protein
MSAIVDRTKQDAAPALLAWHAEQTNEALKRSVDVFFATIADPLADELGSEPVGRALAPFLNALEEAGDAFDLLYHAATGKPNA